MQMITLKWGGSFGNLMRNYIGLIGFRIEIIIEMWLVEDRWNWAMIDWDIIENYCFK